jgi:hypothetical protein
MEFNFKKIWLAYIERESDHPGFEHRSDGLQTAIAESRVAHAMVKLKTGNLIRRLSCVRI